MFEVESECWSLTTAYYSSLKKMSRVNLEIRRALKDAIEFFANGRAADNAKGPPGSASTGSVEMNVKF